MRSGTMEKEAKRKRERDFAERKSNIEPTEIHTRNLYIVGATPKTTEKWWRLQMAKCVWLVYVYSHNKDK